ncbi:hypothetical protein ACO0LF_05440 [Undibacterium sp. Di27W]|uniref:hypothetical protein n=1 Tax=Undibacterium sp. Di27W TaxID=3413036 RepID=UPI003BEFDC9E
MKFKFSPARMLSLVLPLLLATPAHTVFATVESKAATTATTTTPANPALGSQAVFVVAPEELPKQNAGVQIDTPKQLASQKSTKPDVAIQVWSGPVPLAGGLWILVASMPVLASLYFAYQLLLFIKARRRRFSTELGSR